MNNQNAQSESDVGKEFTDAFEDGCARQGKRDQVLADIIARIAAGEKAMIVFCEEPDVREFSAFNLGERNGKLVVDEYD